MATAQELALTQLTAVFTQDWERLESMYDPDVRYLDPDGELIGRTAATDRMKALSAALPDCTHHVRQCTSNGDTAVVEWSLDGEGFSLPVATAYQTRDGHITAERNYWDNMALAPAPAGDQ